MLPPKDKRNKRVTLEDVAKAAKVSMMTVSNVINGKHRGLVGAQTLRRVRREIKRLNYRPHEAARSLRLAHSSVVGLLIIHESHLFMSAPFIATLITGVMNALAESGYNLVVQGVHPKDIEKTTLLRQNMVDGLIAHLSGPDSDRGRCQRILKKANVPLILVQDQPLIRFPDCCLITQDDFRGGRLLAHEVLATGARRLLFIKPLIDWPAFIERERGVRAALAESGVGASLAVIVSEDEGMPATQRAVREYIARDGVPDAILGSNDHIAIAAMKLVQSMGVRVPRDVVVTGYNDFEYRKYADPQITTIHSPVYEMGVTAGQEMVRRLKEGSFRIPEIMLPIALVPGETTPPRIGLRRSGGEA